MSAIGTVNRRSDKIRSENLLQRIVVFDIDVIDSNIIRINYIFRKYLQWNHETWFDERNAGGNFSCRPYFIAGFAGYVCHENGW